MRLSDCTKGSARRIVGVSAEGDLAARLSALGIRQGGAVALLRVSPRRRVFLVETEHATVAIGAEIAAAVEVE